MSAKGPIPASETVYDGTDLQLRALEKIQRSGLTASDLASPVGVALLIERHAVTLTDLGASKAEIKKADETIDTLKAEREELKVDLARAAERHKTLWLEIPISVASGFAINMLTSTPNSVGGWFLLVVSVLMLAFLRVPELRQAAKQSTEITDGTDGK